MPITPSAAHNKGLRVLSGPYKPTTENWMIQQVIEDMDRGKIPHAVIETRDGLEVWRSNHGWLVGGEE